MSRRNTDPGLSTLGDPVQAPHAPRVDEESASLRRASPSCSHCGAVWGGYRACHCAGCHQTFAGLALFDRHRDHRGEHGSCRDPRDLTGYELRDGMWHAPEMTDEAKAKAFGGPR